MRENLFVYGTLMLRNFQLDIIGREVELVPDAVMGFKIEPVVIDCIEYRTLVPDAVSVVEGAVISVSKDELARIDAYEPAEYRRIRVTTTSDHIVWVYVKS